MGIDAVVEQIMTMERQIEGLTKALLWLYAIVAAESIVIAWITLAG